MKEFKSYPKPEPKPKKEFGFAYWNGKRKEYQAKAMKKNKTASGEDKDEVFFRYVWDNSDHFCSECGMEIKEFKRWWIHHVLPKSKYPYFRHDIRNTIILCYQHHNEMESAISAPKLKVFPYCEGIKKDLLASVHID